MSAQLRSVYSLLALAGALTIATHLVVWCTVGYTQSVIWLPSGVAVAGQWLLGWRAGVVVALTTVGNRLAIDHAPDAAIAAGLGSALEGAFGVWLLRRLGLQQNLARLRDAAALLAVAAVAPLISIAFSWIARYALDGWREPLPFYSRWDSWWRMNALGILLATPLILTWRSWASRKGESLDQRPLQGWLLPISTGVTAIALWAVTRGVPPSPSAIGMLYMLLPIPLLGALRLGPTGAVVPACVSALLVTMFTAAEAGPFTCVPIDVRHEPLQMYLLATLAIPLVFGALIAERETGLAARRQLEEKLRQSQKMDAIGKLAGGVAHDFNNLLTAIMGYAESVKGQLPTGTPLRADLDGILQASDRASWLIRQLLAFSRQQVLSPQVLDLGLVVEMLSPILRRLLGERIRLVTQVVEGPHCVRIDRVQMEQVVLNLVLNARDAMPDGGTVEVTTSRAATDTGDHAVLTVRDDGIGMPPEVSARAIDPFFSTKDPAKSSGLGLSTVFGIVEQSGGTLQLQSAPGKGTTVLVCLPRIEAPAAAIAQPAVATQRSAAGAADVLVVEDEAMVRDLVARMLRRSGYSVTTAANGVAALAALNAEGARIDLVVTDMIMPEMGGAELARLLAVQRPALPILFMSGYAHEAAQLQREEHDRQLFLQKPFVEEQLLGAVARLLRRSAAAAQPAR